MKSFYSTSKASLAWWYKDQQSGRSGHLDLASPGEEQGRLSWHSSSLSGASAWLQQVMQGFRLEVSTSKKEFLQEMLWNTLSVRHREPWFIPQLWSSTGTSSNWLGWGFFWKVQESFEANMKAPLLIFTDMDADRLSSLQLSSFRASQEQKSLLWLFEKPQSRTVFTAANQKFRQVCILETKKGKWSGLSSGALGVALCR